MFQLTNQTILPHEYKKHFENDANAGAFCSFEGWVRNTNEGKNVSSLFYEAQSELYFKEAEKILEEAKRKFGVIKAFCIHRIGELQIGDCAIWIGVSTGHRNEAFLACRYIIDEIKKRLPIWKKEYYSDKTSDWVNTQSQITYSFTEKEYYSKQLQLPEFNDAVQEKLKAASVLVIGAGGLGCSALTSLAQSGVGCIGIAEHDVVENSNLHRQLLYRIDDVGLSKIDVASEQLNKINPFIKIQKHSIKINQENVELVIKDYAYILDCSDDFMLKGLLREVCPQFSKVLIQASVYQYEGQLSVITSSNTAPSLSCSTGTCQDAGVLGVIPQILGHLQALEAVKIVSGLSIVEDYTVIIDVLNWEIRKIKEVSLEKNNSEKLSLELSWDQLKQFKQEPVFVDVREEVEIMMHPVESIPTVHLPLSCYEDGIYNFKKETNYIIFCAHGMRSYALAERLARQGLKNIYSLSDGYDALKLYLEDRQRV